MTSSRTRKLLILTDELGRNASRMLLADSYFNDINLTVIIKPGASFEKVTEDIENLTSNFDKFDNVIIFAGVNNARRYRKINKTRLNEIVRNVAHTNLICVGIPLWYNRIMINDVNKLNNYYLQKATLVTNCAYYLDANKFLYRKRGRKYLLVPMSHNNILRKIIPPIKAALTGGVLYRFISRGFNDQN